MSFVLRPYQEKAVQDGIDWMRRTKNGGAGMMVLPTGCHAKGTGILMYDGSIKLVEDVLPGDLLMGPDSTPREVLNLCRGVDEMFEITPIRTFKSFIVNKDHILRLRNNKEKGDKRYINISISDYIKQHNTFKKLYRIFIPDCVFFNKNQILPFDPYFLGVLIGDGSTTRGKVSVSTIEPEIIDFCKGKASEYDVKYRMVLNKPKTCTDFFFTNKTYNTRVKNKVYESLIPTGLCGKIDKDKFIPKNYLLSSIEDRLLLLGGLLDTDGYYSPTRKNFQYSTKSYILAKDILFLCRSLGFKCSLNDHIVKYKGMKLLHHRLSISGQLWRIPNKVARRIVVKSKCRDYASSPFSVNSIGVGEFYGFTISGDNLYLTSDFVVHHNSGKSLIVGELARRINQPLVQLCPSKELLAQNYAKFISYGEEAAIYSASFSKKEVSKVTFATIGSVINNPQPFREAGVKILIVDECHFASGKANQTYDFCRKVGITHVIGLTATPVILLPGMFSSQLKMMNRTRKSFYKDIIHVTQISELSENNFWSKINYIQGAKLKEHMLELNSTGREFTDYSVKMYNEQNDIFSKMANAVHDLRRSGRKKILVFVQFVEDAYTLSLKIPGSIVVHGGLSDKDRDAAVTGYKNGEYWCAINVNVLGTGFDDPLIDGIVHGRLTNSVGIWYQHVGRGVRVHPSKADVDLIDFSGNYKRFGRVEDFTFEKDPKLGWGMFSEDRLLTNIDLSSSKKIFKEKTVLKLAGIDSKPYLWPFGIHKGKDISELPTSYLDWICSDQFIPNYEMAKTAKSKAFEFLTYKQ
jgi:DNA repair protein RadD